MNICQPKYDQVRLCERFDDGPKPLSIFDGWFFGDMNTETGDRYGLGYKQYIQENFRYSGGSYTSSIESFG